MSKPVPFDSAIFRLIEKHFVAAVRQDGIDIFRHDLLGPESRKLLAEILGAALPQQPTAIDTTPRCGVSVQRVN